ncbi:endonuclease/exonuclease/phosphatase family protein [Pedobacter sp. SYSU D00535]|uniref:endonuclease/exonuclease/phosphatase family protein n=1 Tax=Pedobacter sp. SYSU D00535 TaxID=2810308 RepID=UPI001A9750D7|nr:endonuclease/exonuclease/phosphatase family protein [Pedobacter sp. SYSU D00535]
MHFFNYLRSRLNDGETFSQLLFLIVKLGLIAWLILGYSILAGAQSFKVGSFNIRYDTPLDTGNLWVQRAPVVANLIRFHDFDVLGTQEGLKNQLDDLTAALPEYQRYGVGRDDGKESGEFSAIYFKKDKYKLVKSGDFWLSETPEKPSKGWDATCCNRLCTWIQLEDKVSASRFYVFNAHFDHKGRIVRVESAKLILAKMAEIVGKEPAILTGDFNGGHTSEWYTTLAESPLLMDSYKQVKYPYRNNGSTNAFGKSPASTQVIDHVLVTQHFQVKKWGVLTDTYHGKYPSDHFPIAVELLFKSKQN